MQERKRINNATDRKQGENNILKQQQQQQINALLEKLSKSKF